MQDLTRARARQPDPERIRQQQISSTQKRPACSSELSGFRGNVIAAAQVQLSLPIQGGGELDLIAFDLDEVNETLRQIEY